ncbi:hypothetical protein VTL71DRAFT_4861 [Oculimacula yallundae]|uniref:BTB domain-containing protein n=1 Tax=Oculimacula yallundae TaxID=86028 RepID=A0ABR4C4C0_9HELO
MTLPLWDAYGALGITGRYSDSMICIGVKERAKLCKVEIKDATHRSIRGSIERLQSFPPEEDRWPILLRKLARLSMCHSCNLYFENDVEDLLCGWRKSIKDAAQQYNERMTSIKVQDQLRKSVAENEQLRKTVGKLEDRGICKLHNEIDDLQSQLAAEKGERLKADASTLREQQLSSSQVVSFKSQLKEFEAKMAKFCQIIEEQKAENDIATKKFEDLHSQLESERRERLKAESAVLWQRKISSQLAIHSKSLLKLSKAQVAQLQEELMASKTRNEVLATEVVGLRAEEVRSRLAQKEIEVELENFRIVNNFLFNRAIKLEDILERERTVSSASITRLRGRLEAAIISRVKLRKLDASLRSQLDEKAQEFATLARTHRDLKALAFRQERNTDNVIAVLLRRIELVNSHPLHVFLISLAISIKNWEAVVVAQVVWLSSWIDLYQFFLLLCFAPFQSSTTITTTTTATTMDQYEPMDIDSEPLSGVVVFLDDAMEWQKEPNPSEKEEDQPVVMVRHWLAFGACTGPVDWANLEKRGRCASSHYWEPIEYVCKPDPAPAPPAPPAVPAVLPAVSALPSLSSSSSSSTTSSTAASTPPPAPLSSPAPDPPKSPSLDWWMNEMTEASRELEEETRKEKKNGKGKEKAVAPEVQAARDAKKKQLRAKQTDRDATIAAILAKKRKEVVDWPELPSDGDDDSYMDECEQQILDDIAKANGRHAYSIMALDTQPASSSLPPSPSPSTSTSTFVSSTSTMQNGSHNPMEALQSSLLSGKFSDLVIVHGTRKWQAHKVVVCSQSSGLEALIDKLKDTNILDLSFYDHEATVLMMEFLYTSTYSTTVTDIAPSYSLPLHVSVFNLACTLSIPLLKQLALQKYQYTLKNLVSTLSVYFSSVRSIYSTSTTIIATHPELKLIVVETAVLEMQNLLLEGSEQRREFLELTSQVPQFQVDIYEFLMCNGNPQREVEVVEVWKELCEECGAREEGDGYAVTMECKGCGKERTIDVL